MSRRHSLDLSLSRKKKMHTLTKKTFCGRGVEKAKIEEGKEEEEEEKGRKVS